MPKYLQKTSSEIIIRRSHRFIESIDGEGLLLDGDDAPKIGLLAALILQHAIY